MDGANADSDHSMTWEDFFGSTTDLTPTLIGIYDSFLEPKKSLKPETHTLEKAKDARNDPPVSNMSQIIKDLKSNVYEQANNTVQENTQMMKNKEPSRIPNSAKLPTAILNTSALYTIRTKNDENGAGVKCEVSCEKMLKHSNFQRTFREKGDSAFGNLSPNVKRMISGATETTTLKLQKKVMSTGRSSMRQKSNIPLVGATSKISQSGVEILPSVEIYDQPCSTKTFAKANTEHVQAKTIQIKPDNKLNENPTTYDVPTNNRPLIYDIPHVHNNAFESLSLPYIDQSIELSISSNDREFDIKLNSKDDSSEKSGSPSGSPKSSPMKIQKLLNGRTHAIQNKKDFTTETTKTSKIHCLETVETGNLKAVPVKEVAIVSPPTAEVSRPLSMSSIASSSSTSSSGVQNKNGVNSAYLASIESLDDHSDADITSANGSNNFVNSAGLKMTNDEARKVESTIPGHTADETSSLSQLQRVCAEIVHTENVYVEDLRQVVEGYLQEWRQDATFSEEELSELFNNIEHIYTFNRSLCEELSTCQLDATSIARCFVDNTTGFSVYTSYCTGYPRTMERLAALASVPHSARQFRERQSALGHPLPLASYLLKPVQRILKYHLLLQNVVKHCASPETEYALLKMTGIAQHIDDMKRKHEHAVRVQEIQSLLYGWNGPDLTTYGELCAEGTFRVFGAKAMRHAFLFDKMLLVTKNREDGILAYKSHIMCNNMMLVESISGAPLSFHVIPWDAPKSQLTLQARSPRHKREWTLLLKRVILENYNAVIPSHARQLVMELGQNKTDDDMLAEKSHNLITQASMRKQLSAPEYLEKRKLERERRKSFENGARGRAKKANRKNIQPTRSDTVHDCDCSQVSIEKGIHYTCDSCYVDLCSDCETRLNKDKKYSKCECADNDVIIIGEKCPDCERPLQYIDAGSSENLENKQLNCKCSDFKSSLESFGKEFPLNRTRAYHSSDNIVGYTEKVKSKEELSEAVDSLHNVRRMNKTCLKCSKIKENIPATSPVCARKSRCNIEIDKRSDTLRSKSKDDPQRSSKLSKIGNWRRKSEPGLQQNVVIVPKKNSDDFGDKTDGRGNEKIEFECRNCGSNKITKKGKDNTSVTFDPDLDGKKKGDHIKPGVEIKMYNTKNIPKKISKIKKNRTKGLRFATDTSAKFYADLSTDVSTENILHISESNESLNNIDKSKMNLQCSEVPLSLSKDEDIDDETYKKLIEKTDSFKKNELEKVKYLHHQKVINEGSEAEDIDDDDVETRRNQETEEQPLEQIISQLLMQNREFQKLLKKQQLRNSAQRRHQRLLKSHSNPDEVVLVKNTESLRVKSKYYTRQYSESIDFKTEDASVLRPKNEDGGEDEDHIYETLRVVSADSESPNAPRNALPIMPPNKNLGSPLESDYVYLSFGKLDTQNADGIYDVPITSPGTIRQPSTDYYVLMDSKNPPLSDANVYDSVLEVCRRKKDIPSTLPGEYLPMSTEQQSPNTPEIWLSRQKEHFNVPTDRKSGSLPRSFQIITSQDENNLNTFKTKPNTNKTYLNRDGKVLSMDRPFTIASDQSELSYDDVENYMGEEDLLKFNKTLKSSESDYSHNISQSTLELEEEIDRCYKTNFEQINLDKNDNENQLTVSQPNLNSSITSSCEVLSEHHKSKGVEVMHPEHKIYKPTSNMLSLRNVLSRFRNRTPNKTLEHVEINANENNETSPESIKSDPKSPSSEKRSALNPRNYSKNLLQRFKNIISDDHQVDDHNKTVKESKGEIKLVTSTDFSPTTSSIVYSTNVDVISKSVFEPTILTENQKENTKIEAISHSCDNISRKHNIQRPLYGKSISMVSNVPNTTATTVSQSKSNNSNQNLNKLPIYMQGSKHLGARIAQADYVAPTTLTETNDKSKLNIVNLLINKHSVRPDSLFSNSSFVTSSSDSTYHDHNTKSNGRQNKEDQTRNQTFEPFATNSDESFYERSFEKIEQMTTDVFRDSAVYSDQDETEDGKSDSTVKAPSRTITRVESIKRDSFKLQKLTVTSSINGKSTTETRQTIKIQQNEKANDELSKNVSTTKSKVAPPVPVKPKMTGIPSSMSIPNKTFLHKTNTLVKPTEVKSQINEPLNLKTVKRHVSCKPTFARSESNTSTVKTVSIKGSKSNINDESADAAETSIIPPSIQIKRMSLERASLDSATRKLKATTTTEKRSSVEPSKTTKTVLERRMELERLTKKHVPRPMLSMKTPTHTVRPKSITTKVANFERSVIENSKNEMVKASTNINEKYIPDLLNDTNSSEQEQDLNVILDPKESWVKQVVNKFQ